MGILRVDLIDGHQIRGVDRGGKPSVLGEHNVILTTHFQANQIPLSCLPSTTRKYSNLRQRRKP